MKFSEIKGQQWIKEKLIKAVQNNHLAHAQLFCGEPGAPSLAMALAFATYINCTDKHDNDSCGQCPSCRKMDKLIHPDLHFAFPISSTKKITGKNVISNNFLSEWRTFISENPFGGLNEWVRHYGGENKAVNISKEESRQIIQSLALKSFEAEYKVMIIWLPEFMHPSAANGLLKILEEPPQKTLFFLVSQNEDKLLSTILSRTQHVKIAKFNNDELRSILKSKYDIAEEESAQLIQLSDGNINKALEIYNQSSLDLQDIFRAWMRICYSWDFTQIIAYAERFQSMSKADQKNLLHYGINIMHEVLMYQHARMHLSKITSKEEEFIEKFSKVLSLEKIEKISNTLEEGLYHIERNVNVKLIFTDTSFLTASAFRK
ncbi:DNA polymerase III subunit [Aureibacter tunicatorum]|uniref:DNA polymerase-3 subunit delta n=1 Tax=Aureibacter tunicatorum TaxID=866807 RepID=A0AAE3XJ80_9BACT|nr:DNA polymerase III subunit delta [Aureibacter tunicatorum]MDR6237038.1 DNA polymerase-3 subunit delta' [Aureibacter tunicatorum]